MYKGERHGLCRACNTARLHQSTITETKEPESQPPQPVVLFDRDASAPISLNIEQRNAIIILHKAQHTIDDIAHRIPCDRRTVQHWISRYDVKGTVEDLPRSGRPHTTDENTVWSFLPIHPT